jgi:hypothetical protein
MANKKEPQGVSGTSGIGNGLDDAADKGESALKGGFRDHNAAAADKAPRTQKKSYAAELGNALDAHAREDGRKFRPA